MQSVLLQFAENIPGIRVAGGVSENGVMCATRSQEQIQLHRRSRSSLVFFNASDVISRIRDESCFAFHASGTSESTRLDPPQSSQ